MAAALAWEMVATFTEYHPTPGLISGSTVFVSSLVGYLKLENVLPIR